MPPCSISYTEIVVERLCTAWQAGLERERGGGVGASDR